MLKTNNKAVKEAVRDYIIEHLGYNDDENREYTLQEVYDDFIEWRRITNHKKLNFQDSFKDYCQILPGTVAFTHWSEAIQKIVAHWLDQTESERTKYSYQDSETLFYRLIYIQLCDLLAKGA